jgi:CheY-like chemotaxis protein
MAAPSENVMQGTLTGRHILIVEDDPMIALDMTEALEPTGASIATTHTFAEALVLIEQNDLSGAILDHGLPDGDSAKLCARLKEREVPFFIYSGYPPDKGPCADALHIAKPAPDRTLVSAMVRLIGDRKKTTLHLPA